MRCRCGSPAIGLPRICRTRSGGARGVPSGRCGVQGGDSDEVVDGGFDLEPGPVALSSDVAQLASSADGFDPPERFLDAFAYSLRHDVAGVSGGATIDGGSSVRGALRDMWCEPQSTGAGDEVAGVRSSGQTLEPRLGLAVIEAEFQVVIAVARSDEVEDLGEAAAVVVEY